MSLVAVDVGPILIADGDTTRPLTEDDLKGPRGDTGATGSTGSTGPTGAAGRDGRTVLSGSASPSGGTGVDGDFFVDVVGHVLWGPKAGGSWAGTSVNLIGPAGRDGTNGRNGADGVDGAPGADGKTVRSGAGAPSGALGVDGDFYIDTSASVIYGPKTSGAWGSSTSLVGPAGPRGDTGATGATGSTGATGATGAGVPVGGAASTVLVKQTGTDFDAAFQLISNASISGSAAIALSKLATDPLARANHTGTQRASTISDFDTQVRTSSLDQMTAPAADVAWNSRKITGLADPSSAQDAATKNYVDRATKTMRTVQTFAVQGAVTAVTLPGFFIAAASGQTVRLAKVRRLIGAGTSVSFRLQQNGRDITGFGTSGSPLRATTTAGDDDPTDVTLAADDLITLVISAVSGAPTDLTVTVVLEHTV